MDSDTDITTEWQRAQRSKPVRDRAIRDALRAATPSALDALAAVEVSSVITTTRR